MHFSPSLNEILFMLQSDEAQNFPHKLVSYSISCTDFFAHIRKFLAN
jgi:hypothetical protein